MAVHIIKHIYEENCYGIDVMFCTIGREGANLPTDHCSHCGQVVLVASFFGLAVRHRSILEMPDKKCVEGCFDFLLGGAVFCIICKLLMDNKL